MRSQKPERIGVIGLGIIGHGVASWLRSRGHTVHVWSRTPRPFPNFLPTPAEVAHNVDSIQLFVNDGAALAAVCRALRPGLEGRHVVIAHPTVDPSSMVDAAAIIKESGAAFVEAPFTGSKLAAAEGRLVYYIGGSEQALARAKRVLELSSKSLLTAGAVGKASVLKIATNMITAATVQALGEALAIVKSSGISPSLLTEALKDNAARSGAVDLKLPKMITADYEPHFSMRNMFKDASLAAALANMMHIDVPLTTANAGILLSGIERGWGEDDFAATFRSFFSSPIGVVQTPDAAAPEA